MTILFCYCKRLSVYCLVHVSQWHCTIARASECVCVFACVLMHSVSLSELHSVWTVDRIDWCQNLFYVCVFVVYSTMF